MDCFDFIEKYKRATLEALASISDEVVARLIDLLEDALQSERRIFICGNGGSAATASHLAGELGKDASWGRRKRFRVLSLTDNVPWLTAIANDASYDQVFVEQLKNYAVPGDLLIAFSTSGNSENVVQAVEWANAHELTTVGILGNPAGRLGELVRHAVQVDSSQTGPIQEGHMLIQHLVSYFFIEELKSR